MAGRLRRSPVLVGFDGTGRHAGQLADRSWPAGSPPVARCIVRTATRPSPVLAVAVALVAGNPFVLRCVGSGLESGLVVLIGALLLTRAVDLSINDDEPSRPPPASAPCWPSPSWPGPTPCSCSRRRLLWVLPT